MRGTNKVFANYYLANNNHLNIYFVIFVILYVPHKLLHIFFTCYNNDPFKARIQNLYVQTKTQ